MDMETERQPDPARVLKGITWIAPNPFEETTAYLLLHPLSGNLVLDDSIKRAAEELGLRRLDREAEMMWLGTDVLAASLRGDRIDLWRQSRPWWSQSVGDDWTGAAIARRYIVLALGAVPLTGEDAEEVSAYLRRTDRVYAGLVKIRVRVTDQ